MKTVNLVVVGENAVPKSEEDYAFLCSRGIESTRIKCNYIPTLERLLRVKVVTHDIKALLNNAYRKTKRFWQSLEGAKVVGGKKTISLVALKGDNTDTTISAVKKAWIDFSLRWGLHADFGYSETKLRVKLIITLGKSDTFPIISVDNKESITLQKTAYLYINSFHRLSLVRKDDKHTLLNIEKSLGDNIWETERSLVVDNNGVKSEGFLNRVMDMMV